MPCSGVSINPGDNWQTKVNANSVGTTFCIKKGVHKRQSVNPKQNNKFIGEVGGWGQVGVQVSVES